MIKYEIQKRRQSFIATSDEDDFRVEALTYSLNAKKVLSIGVALKHSVKIYKSNRKTPFVVDHSHISPSLKLMDAKFFRYAKYLLTLSYFEYQHFLTVFKSNSERMITYTAIGD